MGSMTQNQTENAEKSRTQQAYDAWHEGLRIDGRKFVLAGLLALAVAFGGGGIWAATAPLSGAALAPGVVVATGQNKIVQHLEGGIIEEIMVNEGQQVERGEILLRLSRATAQANVQRLKKQLNIHRAMQARFRAEQAGKTEITFPEALLQQASDADVADIIETQKSEFTARREELSAEIAVLETRTEAYREEISGLEAQRTSQHQQLALIREELEATKNLLDKGLVPKSKHLALQRKTAELTGNLGQLTSRIARTKQTIAETQQQIIHLKKEKLEGAAAQLRDIQTKLLDVEQRLHAADDEIRRVEVRAPIKGVVVKLHHNTRGGVVSPGDPIMELLPISATLLVEARVRPEDIDVVSIGRPVKLRFTSLRQRITPTLPGEVAYVSADILTDEATKKSYYAARIRIDADLSEALGKARISPGMPVEVYVETGKRTALDYMLDPITDSFARSFLEE